MDEITVTMMEGVAREWRVRVQDAAGNVLDPAGFSFYGGAADGMQVPRRMQVRVEGDVVVLVLPGLWMSGSCWRYQVLCQDVLTGVEWVLCQGDVVLERRVACNGPALHEDAVLVDAVLDSEATVMEVALGDSTAATAEAARQAVAARDGADEAAARAAGDAARVEELKGVVLDVAAGAALEAERAEGSQRGAEAAAGDAAADAQVAAGKAAEAEASRVAAEAAAARAGARAAEAEANAKVAADAVNDALAARDEAAAARGGAEDAMRAAGARADEAEDSAEAAGVARAGAEAALGRAEDAQAGAEAALGKAEEQAAIATAAAEAAQAPESIAAQAARPATMLLVRDELMSILGDASLFDIDTDGQKIIVHTDRLSDEQLTTVTDMLERFVPKFIDVVQYNHHIELTYDEYMKYSKCKDIQELEAANPEYYNDVTETGVFAYNLESIQTFTSWSQEKGWYRGLQKSDKVKKVIMHLPSYPASSSNNNANLFQEMPNLEEIEFSCKGLKGHGYNNFAGNCPKLRRIKAHVPGARIISDFVSNTSNLTHENIEITPNLDSAEEAMGFFLGCESLETWTIPLPKVYELSWAFTKGLRSFEVELPSLNSGHDAFANTQLDKESVVRICNSIPADPVGTAEAGTSKKGYRPGVLTLGIHADLETDEDVTAARATAEAKGWTLTVRWNGTPTSTASVMRFGQLIYAKVGEGRDGERVLDWGHYVTNWEERGYEQFRSLESAYEYFGLPMPEESFS